LSCGVSFHVMATKRHNRSTARAKSANGTTPRATSRTKRATARTTANGTTPHVASVLATATHLFMTKQGIRELTERGVLTRSRDGAGYDLDKAREAYILHMRQRYRSSPRSEADAEHQSAKAQLVRLRIEQQAGRLMETQEAVETIDQIMGMVLTLLGGMAARYSGRDLHLRRLIDSDVLRLRHDMANAADAMALRHGHDPREAAA
jgi:hypothetical protein